MYMIDVHKEIMKLIEPHVKDASVLRDSHVQGLSGQIFSLLGRLKHESYKRAVETIRSSKFPKDIEQALSDARAMFEFYQALTPKEFIEELDDNGNFLALKRARKWLVQHGELGKQLSGTDKTDDSLIERNSPLVRQCGDWKTIDGEAFILERIEFNSQDGVVKQTWKPMTSSRFPITENIFLGKREK